jgi:hypothetical protein
VGKIACPGIAHALAASAILPTRSAANSSTRVRTARANRHAASCAAVMRAPLHTLCDGFVMPALGAGIHVFLAGPIKDADGRDKQGHDRVGARHASPLRKALVSE